MWYSLMYQVRVKEVLYTWRYVAPVFVHNPHFQHFHNPYITHNLKHKTLNKGFVVFRCRGGGCCGGEGMCALQEKLIPIPGCSTLCCWKLFHIKSRPLPRVPLLANPPAVRTKWSSASEMSNLLKVGWCWWGGVGRNEQKQEHKRLSVWASEAEGEAYPHHGTRWLMRENSQWNSPPYVNTFGYYGWPVNGIEKRKKGEKRHKLAWSWRTEIECRFK